MRCRAPSANAARDASQSQHIGACSR